MIGKSRASGRLNPLVALTIAGFDPSSGAGATADLKVFAAHEVYGLAALTALTVQSTQGVRRVQPISARILRETLDCLAADGPIAGVKIGMLGNGALVDVVARFLDRCGIAHGRVVLDPVLRSSSGHALITRRGVVRMQRALLPRIDWLTPNIEELAVLAGTPVVGREAVPEAAARLAGGYPGLNLIVTGGHLDRPDDYLLESGRPGRWLRGRRISGRSGREVGHGTGCAFSSALLARLVAGDSPATAASAAKRYVAEAMRAAQPIGKGRGPLHHFYGLHLLGRI